MPSNLNFNSKLLSEAQKLGNFKYKKDAVNAALEEFIRKRRQKEIVDLFGSIDYDPSYDFNVERTKK